MWGHPATVLLNARGAAPGRSPRGTMTREPIFETERHGGVVVLRIDGEIDVLSAPLLRTHLAELCELHLPILVDLGAVTFMDSMALSVLVLAHKRLVEQGQVMALCCPGRPVRLVLEVSALDQFIDIYDSAEDGCAALDKAPTP